MRPFPLSLSCQDFHPYHAVHGGHVCAAVTISAETSGLAETLEKLMADVAAVDGVVRVEVLAG